jgi:hypothetical protein
MTIKPTHVTFNQAKLLKEKGFKVKVNSYFFMAAISHGLQIDSCIEQDINLDFPNLHFKWSRPEQWIVIEWLRVKHSIWVEIGRMLIDNKSTFWYYINTSIDSKDKESKNIFNTPQEACSKAIDYVLTNLI